MDSIFVFIGCAIHTDQHQQTGCSDDPKKQYWFGGMKVDSLSSPVDINTQLNTDSLFTHNDITLCEPVSCPACDDEPD